VDKTEIDMHLAAGRYYGRESACFNKATGIPKMVLDSEEAAISTAASLNKRETRLYDVEPYPCYFCSERFPETAVEENDYVHLNWHVGREMSPMERELFSGPEGQKILSMEEITIQVAEPNYGMQIGERKLRVHNRSQCQGRDIPCVIHSPSNHHMKEWPLNWRGDTRVMERICKCQVGHPDPDHMAYVISLNPDNRYQGVHGCCGCCRSDANN